MSSTLLKAHPLSNGVDTSLVDILLGQNSVPYGMQLAALNSVTPVMTSNTAPAFYIASVSTFASASFDAWRAFDSDTSSRWITNAVPTGWIQLFFGTAQTVKTYSITSFIDIRAPKDWTLLGSDTGAFAGEEAVLDTQTGIVFGAVETKYFSANGSYKYYRLDVTANNGGSNLQVAEVVFYDNDITSSPSPTSNGWVALPKGSIIQPSTIVIPELLDAADAGTLEYYAAFNGAAGSWYTQAALQALSNVTVTDDEESFELYPRFNSDGSQRPTCGYLARYNVGNLTGGAGSLTPLTPSAPTSLTPLAETPPTPLTPI